MNIAIKQPITSNGQALIGKVSLVTGSTSGIGLGIARALAAAGSRIVLNGFGKPDEIARVQAELAAEFNVDVSYSGADMSKPESIREMIEQTWIRPAAWMFWLTMPASSTSPLQDFHLRRTRSRINLSSAFHTTGSRCLRCS
jgi:3-hydroxybutyrate dehydrogenase